MTRRRGALVLAAGLVTAALLTVGPAPRPPLAPLAAQAAGAGWTTYHYDNARDGNDTAEAAYGSLTGQWTSPALDGQLLGSALVYSGLVFVATENNTVYALRETDGSIYWSTHLAPPVPASSLSCGNIDPVGITGTPVIDTATGTLYAVGLVGSPTLKYQLFSLQVANGALAAAPRDIVLGDLDPRAAGQRGALALAGGNVYVPFGGRDGDCSPYHPLMVALPVNGSPLISYDGQAGHPGQDGAGFWAASGEAVDGAGNVYAASGNGLGTTCSTWDHSNAVLKLSPSLAELDYWVEPNWCSQSQADVDLGSVAPVLLPGGLAFVDGKAGDGWVLNTAALGHFSSTPGTQPAGCSAVFGGFAAAGGTVYVPCESPGLVAISSLSTGSPPFSVAWSTTRVTGAPIVVGGSVWALDEYGSNLVRFNPATGAVTNTYGVGGHNRFQTPSADSGRILVAAGAAVHELNFGSVTPPSPPPPPVGGVLHTVTPGRLFDTRSGGSMHRLTSGEAEEFHVLGTGGIPTSHVSAVVLNVTAVNPDALGFLAVYPGGTAWPQNSNLNFGPGGSASPNLVLAQVGSNGNVAFINGSAGGVDVVADVFGYFDDAGNGAGPSGRYRPVTPARLLDTRSTGGALGPGGTATVTVAGAGGVPAGASAVVLNVTAVDATTGSFLAAYPAGTSWPGTSNLNFGPGDAIPNRVIVPLGGGAVTIINASGTVDVIVDVSGWFTDGSNPAAANGVYTPVTPSRVIDTRSGTGPLGAGQSMAVQVGGRQGVPLTAASVAVNVTVTDETAPSFLAAYPDPGPWPGNSDLNTAPGLTSTNAVLVGLGSGRFDVIHANGSADVIVDVEGWFS